MPSKHLICIALVLTALISCKKKHEPSPQPPPVDKPFVTDVYVAGYTIQNGGSSTTGVYWKNGRLMPFSTDMNTTIYAITVQDTDVYMAGTTSNGAAYWKNGNVTYLHPGALYISQAYAIAVSGTDIYVGGTVAHSGDSNGRAVYWKNGAETDLTSGSSTALVNAIVVSGSDVYSAGQNNQPDFDNVAGVSVAALWKNQTQIPLDGAVVASYGSFAKGIAVSGNDVYVAGYIEFGAALWKNGSLQNLDDNSGYPFGSAGFAVGVNKTDVYVIGEHGNEAAYWKNGTIKDMISGTFTASGVNGICFQGDDVYMSGSLNNDAVYWKNDTVNTMQSTGATTVVSCIAVSRHQ
jgi:hypothetical protein